MQAVRDTVGRTHCRAAVHHTAVQAQPIGQQHHSMGLVEAAIECLEHALEGDQCVLQLEGVVQAEVPAQQGLMVRCALLWEAPLVQRMSDHQALTPAGHGNNAQPVA